MPTVTIASALELALQHHAAGRLTDAEVIYRQILAVQPNHAEALHLLGVIAHQAGRDEAAVELIGRAIQLGFGTASAYSNLGEACRKLGRLDEAIAAYRRAVQINPALAAAHGNLGSALMEKGEIEPAMAALKSALQLNPDSAEVHGNLGACFIEQGRLGEAIDEYRRALALNPDLLEANFNLGVALTRQGRLKEAIGAYRRTTELRPDYAEAHHNLGAALIDDGQLEGAEAALRRALELKADYAEAHYNLGNALREQGRPDEAVVAYRRAIELKPDYPDPHQNLAHTHWLQGRLDAAIAAYRGAGEHRWSDAAIQSNLIFTLHYAPGIDECVIEEEQAHWNRRFGDPLKPFILPHRNDRDPERRLRIGYVSADLRDHTLGRNLLPLFRHHDHREFEIISYAGAAHSDEVTDEFRGHSDQWRSTFELSDEALAKLIRQDGIDILVDLALHTARNRLPVFAREPAPVQVSFAGYPGSTGLEAIPFRISDRWLESEMGDRRWEMGDRSSGDRARRNSDLRTPNSDRKVFLIDSFWCYDPCGIDVSVNELPAGATGWITFGSLNNFSKVNDPVLKLWARVLKCVTDSRLLLLCPQGSHRQRTLEILSDAGITKDRVEFAEPRGRRDYLELYHRVDVMLDPFPYGGHTTSLDALWMGVPVVSLAGGQIVSRAGLSQLSNLGLRELVAFSEEEYVRIAAELGADLARLAELRATLRARMEASVLMGGERFASGIERTYRAMWQQWCATTRV
ncbi:MAG TPA: tetratricopeptide repeat protein [Chthoniobacter sp.]|jgi:predicted O-linked N-acetylglucosamine transferase (SPINDLY family)